MKGPHRLGPLFSSGARYPWGEIPDRAGVALG